MNAATYLPHPTPLTDTRNRGFLYGEIDIQDLRPYWTAYHQGRREYFPACPRDRAIATAEKVLGVFVDIQPGLATSWAAGEPR